MDTIEWLERLLSIDSPTGYTHMAIDFIEQSMADLGLATRRTSKGACVVALGNNPTLCVAAHADTLGLIVTKIKSDGTLAFSTLGSPLLACFDGSYVRVYASGGGVYNGTLLLNNPSAHANREAGTAERKPDSMHVRLDEPVVSADDVKGLGIRVGDIIAIDARTAVLQNGYIKSHFLDNKAGCAVLYGIAKRCVEQSRQPAVELFFSTYEEVGHGGAAGYSPTVTELLVVDMGVVGDACDGSELRVSICAKDSGGPYDFTFRSVLATLAEQYNIPYAIDVYPYYSSDGTAAWRAGVDARIALIGPGVSGSHGMERAHSQGIDATIELCDVFFKHHLP